MVKLFLLFFIGSALGYFFIRLTSEPKSRFHKHVPKIKFKFIQISPCLELYIGKNRIIHIHHWLSFTIILLITFTSVGLFEAMTTKGFLLGGIAQGLTYDDWKKIYVKKK